MPQTEHTDCPAGTIRLQSGSLACEILPYGATLRSLTVPDRTGRPVDVVLGFDRVEEYAAHRCYFGATVGPNANRIGGATCLLNGKRLRLDANDGENSLHSGTAGLDRQEWEPLAVSEEAVTLLCTHPDGRGGLPGDLTVAVTYWLEGNALLIEYRAVSRRDTLCNLTNHSYFNLDGHGSGPIDRHRICLHAHSFTPIDGRMIPTGELRALGGTPMDLSSPVELKARLEADFPQLRLAGGFDHNYVIDPAEEPLRPAAELWGAESGIRMELWTDRPGVQFYTGNFIPAGLRGKGGAVYGPRQGLCLETQAFPDAPNHPSFPSTLLKAGREWQSRTVFRFGLA